MYFFMWTVFDFMKLRLITLNVHGPTIAFLYTAKKQLQVFVVDVPTTKKRTLDQVEINSHHLYFTRNKSNLIAFQPNTKQMSNATSYAYVRFEMLSSVSTTTRNPLFSKVFGGVCAFRQILQKYVFFYILLLNHKQFC
jgi:hypothetical protein